MADPTAPKPPAPKITPPAPKVPSQVSVRVPAMDLLEAFLKKTKIALTLTPLDYKIKVVSDGSIIIEKPTVFAKYQDER